MYICIYIYIYMYIYKTAPGTSARLPGAGTPDFRDRALHHLSSSCQQFSDVLKL